MPGPGQYTNKCHTVGVDALKFTLKPRINENYERKDQPGPGEYKPLGINRNGQYVLSTVP